MQPHQLIGIPFRLGADPAVDGATDCVNLVLTVLRAQGIPTPQPQGRAWLRRLRRDGVSVFWDELEAWGRRVGTPGTGTVALLDGRALAVWWEDGWLALVDDRVQWVYPPALQPLAMFGPRNLTS